jgi:hypothetical protein
LFAGYLILIAAQLKRIWSRLCVTGGTKRKTGLQSSRGSFHSFGITTIKIMVCLAITFFVNLILFFSFQCIFLIEVFLPCRGFGKVIGERKKAHIEMDDKWSHLLYILTLCHQTIDLNANSGLTKITSYFSTGQLLSENNFQNLFLGSPKKFPFLIKLFATRLPAVGA